MTTGTGTKHCTGCDRDLPADAEHFFADADKPDGFKTRCKVCDARRRRVARTTAADNPPVLPVKPPVPEGFECATISTEVSASGDTLGQWLKARRESEHETDVQPSVPAGHRLKGVSTYVDGQGLVRGQWIKTDLEREQRETDMREALRGLGDEWATRHAPTAAPETVDSDLLCVYPIGDPHFGMYAWAAETGDDYDLQLAREYHVEAIRSLVNGAPPAEEALIIELGDFFHMDNSTNQTPRSHHTLDVDTRRPKVARAGVRAMRELIENTLRKHQRTRVWCLRGNHDEDSTAMLQIALSMFYEGDPRVIIEESPAIAYYHRFGENLLGATHTHTVKDRAGLGEMMATHRPKDWGLTCHRYYYCGHVHHDSLIETRGGVIVETMRTLAGKDKFAADNFYNSGRDMKCDVLHRTDGRIKRHTIGIRQIQRQIAATKGQDR